MKKFLAACALFASFGALSFSVSLEGSANVYFMPQGLGSITQDGKTLTRGSLGLDIDASVFFPVYSSFDLGATVGLGAGFPLSASLTQSTQGEEQSGSEPQKPSSNSGLDWNVFNAGPAIRMHFEKVILNRDITLYVSPGISFRRRIMANEGDRVDFNLNLWAFYINAALRLWLSEERVFGIEAGVNYSMMLPFASSTYKNGDEWEFFAGVVYNLDIRRRPAARRVEQEDAAPDDSPYTEDDSGI